MKALFTRSLIVFLCLITMGAYAEDGDNSTGEIKGKIIDESSRKPVSYASVALISTNDGSLVTGVISNENGEYLLGNVPYGEYNIKVSYLGYKASTVENINLSRKNKIVEVTTMNLATEVTELDQVTVSKERLKGEEKIDRTVFTINDDIRKVSSTGIDVLKHIPSVTVDFQDNVSLEGQSDIQYYVEGIMRNKDFIAQLDPEMIDKIELITNPGVKYDSDISAVINIVLKKVKRSGINGMVQVPVTHPDKAIFNPMANIEYGNQKFRIYLGDRLHYERFKGSESLYTELDESNPNPYSFEKYSTGYKSWQSNYMNYGIDFFISENTSLNLLGEWQRQRGLSTDYFSTNSTYQNDELSSYHESYQDSKNTYDNQYFSAFFKHNINDKGSEISAELSYYTQRGDNNNEFTEVHYFVDDLDNPYDTLFRSDLTKSLRNTLELRADYSFVIKNVKNETGIRVSELWMNNDFTNIYLNETPESELDKFEYTESRRAMYYNATGKIKQINWQIGVRGEYSYINIYDSLNVKFTNLLPQVSISRNFEKGQSLKLTFRRKLLRPSIQDLNPFETWGDSLHMRKGNPELKPALENRFELVYSKNFESNFLAPKVYLRYTKNGIHDLTVINEQGVTEITRANIGNELEYGVGLVAAFQFFKIWRLNGNFAVYNREISTDQQLSLTDNDQKVSYRISGSTIVQLPKKFSVMGFAQYNSPNISYQRLHSRDFLFLFGVEKQISEKAKISAMYNPFIKNFTYGDVVTRSQGYYEHWAGNVDVHHLFMIEFTYNFSYGGKVNKINRTVEYEKGNEGGAF